MGMSEFYGAHDDDESLATLKHALDLGVNFLDTADAYGPYTNEELVGRALRGRRQDAFLATKFGFVRDERDPAARALDGRPQRVLAACEGSLKRLKVESIDLYYLHRVDPAVPVEDTVGAMAELVRAGKVRHLGLSEVSAPTLERAHRVHPITALQSEYSLWTRDPEGLLATCDRLGVGSSPTPARPRLHRGAQEPEDFAADDYRRILAFPGRELRAQPGAGGEGEDAGARQGLHAGAAGARMGNGAGRAPRAHPGYAAHPQSR
jgi:aryl-alcohol dehydrogenase-like predicted oxidoreductase